LVNNDFNHSGTTLQRGANLERTRRHKEYLMNIVISYDQSTAILPAGFTSVVSAVAAFYQSQFTDNITFNLHVGYGEVHGSALSSGALGQSSYFLNQYSYSQIRNALSADQKSVDDSTGLGNVPATDPIGGTHQYWAAQVQATALGLRPNTTVSETYVGFSNTAAFDYDRSNGITAGRYDFYGTVAHEVAEVMGKNLLVGGTIGTTTNSYVLSDLFHYSSPGVRDFSGTTAGYFSINGGATNLDNFNTNPGGDFGDWAASAGNDSWRAFSNSGVINAVTETDLRFLDVIGFDRVPPGNPAPPAATTAALIMRHGSDGQYYIYDIGNNTLLAAYKLGQVGTDWTVAGLGGFFGTDTNDMLLRNSNTGAFQVYDVKNNNITGSASLGTVGLNWQIMGFGNFGSFGETDMIMRNSSTGGLQVYDIRNNQIINSNPMGTVGLNWQFSGVGNFSSRGTSDMILRNSNTGGLQVYDINSNQITGSAFIGTIGLDWQFSGVGNFSGAPGETDLLLRNNRTGGLEVYNINRNQLTGAAFIGTIGLDWQFAGVGPIRAAGASDLVLRNVNTGAFQVYNITSNRLIGSASLGSVGLDWQVGGIAVDPPTASTGSMGGSSEVGQLVQAMAGFGGGSGAPDNLNSAPLGTETSQQALLTTPQHG
jgi:hypothetical protein